MKKILLLSLILGIVGVVFTIITSVDPAPIPLTEPSTDPAASFPQHGKIYRDKGKMTSHGNSKFVVFDYYRFHADGTVISTTRSVTNQNDLNKRFYADLAEELAPGGEGNLRQVGRFEILDGKVPFTLGKHTSQLPAGTPADTPSEWFLGEIDGDQIRISKSHKDTGEPYGGFRSFAPIGPEAQWKTMKKD